MPFTTPSFVHKLPFDPPDSIPIHEFLFSNGDNKYGRYPIEDSLPPFTCGITGKQHSAVEVKQRIEHLAAAIATELGFEVNSGEALDKVVTVFTVNTVCMLFLFLGEKETVSVYIKGYLYDSSAYKKLSENR